MRGQIIQQFDSSGKHPFLMVKVEKENSTLYIAIHPTQQNDNLVIGEFYEFIHINESDTEWPGQWAKIITN